MLYLLFLDCFFGSPFARVIQLHIRLFWHGLQCAPPSYVYLHQPLSLCLRNTQKHLSVSSR